jgi:type I restriction enzyme S subunit
LAWSGTPGSSFGAHIWRGGDAVLNQHIFRVDIDETQITKEWAVSAINYRLNRLIEIAHGGVGLKHVTRGMVEELSIPLPRIAEQRRIAAILDKAEDLRTRRNAAIDRLADIERALFMEMFGEPLANTKSWHKCSLAEISKKITDGEHLNPEFSLTGMRIVMAGNVTSAGVDLQSCKRVEWTLGEKFRRKCDPIAGDLLVVSRGATIGRLCVVRTEDVFCLMGSVILIRPKKPVIESEFLGALMNQPSVQRVLYKTSGSSAQQAMYLKDIKQLECIVPPVTLQRTFALRIAQIEATKAAHQAHLAQLSTLFVSLQNRAFRGEL